MATLSFRKLSSTAPFPTSGMTEGTIYFCPQEHTIGIATSATNVEKYYGGNVKDAKYANNKLTITYNDGTAEAVLNFSDMASADAVKKELDSLKALHAVASTDGSGKKTYKTVAAEITDKLAGLNLSEVKNASGYISAVSQSNGVVAATAKSFDASIPASDPSTSNAPTTAAVKTYVDGKINDLDVPEVNGGSDGYIVSVKQQDGKVEATSKKFITDLSTNLDALVETNAPTSKAVKDYVAAEIGTAKSSLDFSDTVPGDFVKSISRANGVVTISKDSFDESIDADSTSTKAPTSKAVAELVKTQLSSLGNALHFRGAGTKAEMEALTNKADGDIFIINSEAEQGKEYVYSGNAWVELGDEGKAAALINALDVTDNPVPGEYVSAVSQTDGKIKVTRTALPTPTYNSTITADTTKDGNAPTTGAVKSYVGTEITGAISNLYTGDNKETPTPLAAGDGKFVSSVGQQNGKVSIGSTAFNTVIDDTTKDSKVAPTTKATKDYVDGKINGLDVTAIGGPSKIITTVAQVDGKVQATASSVDTVIDTTTAVDPTPDTIHIPNTKAVKTYVDTEVSKAVNGALVWSSWE